MMFVLNKIIINKKFILILWFRYIFLFYNFLYFYNIDKIFLDKLNSKKILSILNVSNMLLGSRCLFTLRGLFSNKSFLKFLDNNFIVLQSNNFIILSELLNYNYITLQAISYKNYFINNSYLCNIQLYNFFYSNNYLLINNYLLYFVIIFFKLKIYLQNIFLLGTVLLKKVKGQFTESDLTFCFSKLTT